MNLQHLTREDLVAMMLAPFSLKTSPPVASELKPALAEASSAEELAIRLAAAQELILRDLKSRLARGPLMDSPQTLKDWLRLTCAGLEHEVCLVVYLDATHRLITEEVMFRGSLTQTSVYPREVVKGALKHNAAAVALAHNHPSGHPDPNLSRAGRGAGAAGRQFQGRRAGRLRLGSGRSGRGAPGPGDCHVVWTASDGQAAPATDAAAVTRAPVLAFDDDGYLMPGAIDTAATPARQQQQLVDQLVSQSLTLAEATRVMWRWATQDTGNASNPLSTTGPDGEPRPQSPAEWDTGRAFDGSPARPATPHEIALLDNAVARIQQTDFPQTVDLQNNPNQRLIHVSFDGTWNLRDRQPFGTNPDELEGLISQANDESVKTLYMEGIGTSGGRVTAVVDGSVRAGTAGSEIVDKAYAQIRGQIVSWHETNPDAEIVVSLAGFSRGGPQALDLANRLQELGILDPGRPGQFLIAPGAIRFGPIMLYDPVDMTSGVLNVRVPSNASSVLVLGAGNEFRSSFPAVSVVDPSQPGDSRITRIELPGAHTDIGRGYDQGIGNYTLQMGRDFLARSGVPISELPPDLRPGAGPVFVHDSLTDGWGHPIWQPRVGGRETIVTPNPRPQPKP